MRKISFLNLVLMIVIVSASLCLAQDINFEVHVDRNKVSLGSSLKLNLTFHGTQDFSAPDLPEMDGFSWRYMGPSTRMSIVNGRTSSSVTHIYTLVPLKVGIFQIPSLSIEYKGKTYTSDPIQVEVIQGPVGQPMPGQTGEDKAQGLEDRIFLVMQVDRQSAYVNEIIHLMSKLYINNLAIRDIQYPEFGHDGFSVDKFAEPRQYREVFNGMAHDVIEFNTDIFGMRPGELKLGPAELKCNLIVRKESRRRRSSLFDDDFFGSDIFNDFFGRYEAHPLNLKSIDIPIQILALPQENKPDDFTGALGNYTFSLEADPREVKVGDPITLKMIISGNGNFKTVTSPSLDFKDDFKIYEPEVNQEPGRKTFEQVIIPKDHNITEIPEISFSFFDTASGEYKEIIAPVIPITVNPLPKGEELKVFEVPEEGVAMFRKREILGRDIIYIKDSPGRLRPKGRFLCQNKLFIAIQFLPILAIISILIFQKRKERLQIDIRYARKLRAPRKAKKNLAHAQRLLDSKEPDKFFDAVFKTLQEYLGDKFHLPTVGITSDVVEELTSRSIDKEIIEMLKECFNSCDRARYAPSSITKEEMYNTFKLLREIIDRLERARI